MAGAGAVRAAAATMLLALALGACGADDPQHPGDGSNDSEDSNGTDSTGEPAPDSDPLDLVNMWRISGADGEDDPAWLRLDAGDLMLWRDCGYLSGTWQATSSLFVASLYAGSGDCVTDAADMQVDWLNRVQAYRPAGEGWELLDDEGQVVATLTIDGAPEPIPTVIETMAQAPEVTDATREAMRLAEPLPDGETAATRADLLGRWIPRDATATDPYAEFVEDGTWSGSDGCNGGGGRWLTDDAGALLTTAGASTLIGCDGAPVPGWVARARTAAIDGADLVLYDRDGQILGKLVRG